MDRFIKRYMIPKKDEYGNSKCCCGRDDQHHAVMAALKMDHICNICKGKCYGLCTESYTCFKCLWIPCK